MKKENDENKLSHRIWDAEKGSNNAHGKEYSNRLNKNSHSKAI